MCLNHNILHSQMQYRSKHPYCIPSRSMIYFSKETFIEYHTQQQAFYVDNHGFLFISCCKIEQTFKLQFYRWEMTTHSINSKMKAAINKRRICVPNSTKLLLPFPCHINLHMLVYCVSYHSIPLMECAVMIFSSSFECFCT